MSWSLYVASAIGFWAACALWFVVDEYGNDDDDIMILLIVIPVVSAIWPLVTFVLLVTTVITKLTKQEIT